MPTGSSANFSYNDLIKGLSDLLPIDDLSILGKKRGLATSGVSLILLKKLSNNSSPLIISSLFVLAISWSCKYCFLLPKINLVCKKVETLSNMVSYIVQVKRIPPSKNKTEQVSQYQSD